MLCVVVAQGDASTSSSKLESDCQFLRSLNETLLANQKQFQGQVGGLQQQLAEKEAEVKDLQEQVGGWVWKQGTGGKGQWHGREGRAAAVFMNGCVTVSTGLPCLQKHCQYVHKRLVPQVMMVGVSVTCCRGLYACLRCCCCAVVAVGAGPHGLH
jgi:hypothetical protein